jgi:pilus assembly protein CpaB
MRRRIVMVLALASLIGLAASFFVYRVVTQLMAAPRVAPTASIVVAAADIGLAETVTAAHVRLVSWPEGSVPAGAIRSLADAEGRVVRSTIVAGEPLLDAKLAPQLSGRGGIMPMLVPEGRRGVSIKVDDAIRESGFVLPNSHVDVLVSMPKRPMSPERIAKVILQDVLVLAAGQTVEMRDNKPITVTTVTLALSPEEAERLALAQTEGRLTIATRNLRDNRTVETRGITAEALLSTAPPRQSAPAVTASGPRKPSGARRTTPAARAPGVSKPRVYTVSVVRAGKATEQRFILDESQIWREATN